MIKPLRRWCCRIRILAVKDEMQQVLEEIDYHRVRRDIKRMTALTNFYRELVDELADLSLHLNTLEKRT